MLKIRLAVLAAVIGVLPSIGILAQVGSTPAGNGSVRSDEPILNAPYSAKRPIRNWTGAPCSHQRTWVDNDGAQPLQRSLPCGVKGAVAEASILVHRAKALERPILGPGTLWRTWGTRPAANGFC
jgi:hypothetical protein